MSARHDNLTLQSVDAEIKADPFGYARKHSLSDLHHRLGKLVEYRPGAIARPQVESTTTWDSNARPFEGLALDVCVRPLSGFGEQMIATARDEMGEARWAELNAEWGAGNV